MTFLEYICERLMGPPAFRSGGSSYWCCPAHDDSDPSFCTRPHKEGYKDRFTCWGCGAWGDAHDLLLLVHPEENRNYQDRLDRLARWRKEYRREIKDGKQLETFSLRGLGSTMNPFREDEQAAQVFLLAEYFMEDVANCARKFGVPIEALVVECRRRLAELKGKRMTKLSRTKPKKAVAAGLANKKKAKQGGKVP